MAALPVLLRTLTLGAVTALTGCANLQPTVTVPITRHILQGEAGVAPCDTGSVIATGMRTLVILPPQAAPGFDSERLVYLRYPGQLEAFSRNAWVAPPAQMLAPLLVQALRCGGHFGAVVLAPGPALGDMRLDTQILRMQQNFETQPSRVQFTLRASLLDGSTRRVVAWRDVRIEVAAASDTPQGGVSAANQAVHQALLQLRDFVTASTP